MGSRSKLAVCLFIFSLGLYIYSLAPSVMWGDSVHVQMQVILGGSSYMHFEELEQTARLSEDGLPFASLGVAAWDHPLYVFLGQIFIHLAPWGDLAYRVNLMSAIAASLVVVLVYLTGAMITQNHWAAALGALALAVSHTFWFHAVVAEVYSLHLLFMVSLIVLAYRWSRERETRDIFLFYFLAGLGLANHVMLALTLAPTLVYLYLTPGLWNGAPRPGFGLPRARRLLRAIASRNGLVCTLLFLAGFAPWWIQYLRMARRFGPFLTLQLAAGAPWLPKSLAVISGREAIANLATYTGWLLYQFMPLGVVLAIYGWWRMRQTQPRLAWLLFSLWFLHAGFSANYAVDDRFAFHLPSYLIVSLALIAGLDGLLRHLEESQPPNLMQPVLVRTAALAAMIGLPVILYANAPLALHAIGFSDENAGIRPVGTGVRDALAIFLDPNQRGDDSAARFGRSTLAQLPPQAIVFTPNHAEGETYLLLRYFQLVENLRPDVHLESLMFYPQGEAPKAILDIVHAQSGCRPLYLASLNPQAYPIRELQGDFDIIPHANLYHLVDRHPASLSTCGNITRPEQSGSLKELVRSIIQWR